MLILWTHLVIFKIIGLQKSFFVAVVVAASTATVLQKKFCCCCCPSIHRLVHFY